MNNKAVQNFGLSAQIAGILNSLSPKPLTPIQRWRLAVSEFAARLPYNLVNAVCFPICWFVIGVIHGARAAWFKAKDMYDETD